MMAENTERRGWMLVKLSDETRTEDVAKAIWKANESDWLKAKGSDIELGCVSRADVVGLDPAMATALGYQKAIVVPIALNDGVTPQAAGEAIKGFAGQGAEVYWLEALVHNPAVVVMEEGVEALSTRLPTSMSLDKEGASGVSLPTAVLEGRNAWG
jgi:hypothetical protein